ncbi:hypothetical protein ACFX12_018782 [Malus domestica]
MKRLKMMTRKVLDLNLDPGRGGRAGNGGAPGAANAAESEVFEVGLNYERCGDEFEQRQQLDCDQKESLRH